MNVVTERETWYRVTAVRAGKVVRFTRKASQVRATVDRLASLGWSVGVREILRVYA